MLTSTLRAPRLLTWLLALTLLNVCGMRAAAAPNASGPAGAARSLAWGVPNPTSFLPTSGTVGTTVDIGGSFVGEATEVRFNGVVAVFWVVSPIYITAVVPAGATTGSISVTSADGTRSTQSSFTVFSGPGVTSFSPASGSAGTPVTLTGAGFSGATNVRFNGTAAAFNVVSPTQITTTVPAGAITGKITVTTPAGTGQSSAEFTVLNTQTPTALTLSRTSIAENMPAGIAVGTFTTTDPDVGDMHTYSLVAGAGNFSIIGDQLRTTVPFDYETQASYPIRVRTTDRGGQWLEQDFTISVTDVVEVPVVSGFSPTSGAAGVTSVTLSGNNFTRVTAVRFNGQPATGYTVNPAGTSLTVTVPAGATTGRVTVTNPDGTGTSTTNFQVLPAPTITNLTPASGPVWSSVTIDGTNFVNVTAVRFNGVNATTFTLSSSFSLTAQVPVGATSGPISVSTASGTGTSATSFTVVPGPVISSFSPTSGPAGTRVVITGSNFTGATGVTFGPQQGVPASFTVDSPTQITAIVPINATTGWIRVLIGNASAGSGPNFTVQEPAPTITSFTPAGGRPTTTTVTITGTNLTNATVVTFVQSSVRNLSNTTTNLTASAAGTQLTFNVPPGGGTGPISVTTPGGTAVSSAIFTVYERPFVRQMSTDRGPIGSNVSITGFYLSNVTSVTFGGRPASFIEGSGTGILAIVPAGATSGDVNIVTLGGSAVAGYFNVEPGPGVSSFTPASGAPGTTVTITGAGFTAATAVRFNGVDAPGFVVNAAGTQITVAVPAGATTGFITVAAPAGTGSSFQTFVVAAPAPNLLVTGPQAQSGTYNNVNVAAGGTLNLTGNLRVEGTLTVQSGGTFDDGSFVVTGPGAFALQAGATLIIRSAAGLSASGNSGSVQASGPRTFSRAGRYVYAGSTAQTTGPGLPARVRDLLVNNSSDVTLSQPVAIRGVLHLLSSGNLQLNGQALTLLSDADSTAAVANTGAGAVVGTATVQRYVSGQLNAGPGYRHFSAPVSGTTVADLATPAFAPVVNPAYNSATAPNNVTPFPTVFGYDETRGLSSPATTYSTFDKGWVSPTSTTDPLEVGRGYTVNLAAGQTVDFVGSLNNGPVSRTLTRSSADGGWHLLGNPYPSPIDWSQVTVPSGVDNALYVFQSTAQYAGQYRSYVNGIGNPVVALGQGFFVRASSGSPAALLTFTNAARTTLVRTTDAPLNRTNETRPLVQLTLRSAANGLSDDAYVYFQAGAGPGFGPGYDAYKLTNPSGLSLASVVGSTELSINGLPAAPTVVPLQLRLPQHGSYTLTATQLLNFAAGDVLLLDAATGQRINLSQQPGYAFTATAAGVLPGRFSLQLAPRGVTATTGSALAAATSLYPNPARHQVHLQLPAALDRQVVQVSILNALGQSVLVRTLPATRPREAQVLPLAGLPKGVYTVHLSAAQTVISKRLVVE